MNIEIVSRKAYRLMKKYHIKPKKNDFPDVQTPVCVCFGEAQGSRYFRFPTGEEEPQDAQAVKSTTFITDAKFHKKSKGIAIYYAAPKQWMKCGRLLNCVEYIFPSGDCLGILYSTDTDTAYCTSYPAYTCRIFGERECFFCDPEGLGKLMENKKVRIKKELKQKLFDRMEAV